MKIKQVIVRHLDGLKQGDTRATNAQQEFYRRTSLFLLLRFTCFSGNLTRSCYYRIEFAKKNKLLVLLSKRCNGRLQNREHTLVEFICRISSLSIRIIDRFREKRYHVRAALIGTMKSRPVSSLFSLLSNENIYCERGEFISRALMNSKRAVIGA